MEGERALSPAPSRRLWGRAGPVVLLVHGGPGAPGYLAPLAVELARDHRVVEALERRAGPEGATVDAHVADLAATLDALGAGPVAVVGHSSGAMIALAFAAAHPERVRVLCAVGCGTFDPRSRARLEAERERRLDATTRAALAALETRLADPDERLAAAGRLLSRVDSVDLIEEDLPLLRCDAAGHRQTWEDLLRLQREGRHPQAFAAIRSPVTLLHGRQDPHPADGVLASLEPFLDAVELVAFERCGHYPWLERAARGPFLGALRARLSW